MLAHRLNQGITPPDTRPMGQGQAFGTFGELLQGRLEEGDQDFLVTFPIACYAYASFSSAEEQSDVRVYPSFKQKSQHLASLLLKYYHLPEGGSLQLTSDLPVGKGMASSSADLVATARAIASCFDIEIPTDLLLSFLRQIEPTDGVMYPGIVSFYHRQVYLREVLGFLSPLTIVSIDEGGELDTIQFNQRAKAFTRAEKQEYQRLLERISLAIHQNDLQTLGAIATRSAMLNQQLNPKRDLESILAICEEIEGLGIIVAHSGTCAGILLSLQDPRYQQQYQTAQALLTRLSPDVSTYYSLDFSSEERKEA